MAVLSRINCKTCGYASDVMHSPAEAPPQICGPCAIAAAEAIPSPEGCIERFWWLGGVCVLGYEGSFLRPGDNIVNQVFVMPSKRPEADEAS